MSKIVGKTGRSNVSFNVVFDDNRIDYLRKVLSDKSAPHGTVVFCPTRKMCQQLHEELIEYPSVVYHAGLSEQKKEQNLLKWMENTPNLVFATTAMG